MICYYTSDQEPMDQETMDILRTFAYQVGARTSRSSNDLFRHLFQGRINTPSDYIIQSTVTDLSGTDIVRYHCCINSCMAFVGPDSELDRCRIQTCGESRYHTDGRTPRKIFFYIPLIPRLIGLYRSEEMARRLMYRHEYDQARNPNFIGDSFDGNHYQGLRGQRVVVDGEELEHTYFNQPTDIALAAPGDGFQVYKRKIFGTASASALIAINLNLDAKVRTHQDNVMSLGLIPGEHGPKDTNTFLWPFAEECKDLARGIPDVYNAFTRTLFTLRGYVIHIIGDAVWIEKVQGMNGHNGFSPCRICPIQGVYYAPSRHYYFPLKEPGENGASYSLTELLRTKRRKHEDFTTIPERMANARTEAERKRLGRVSGFSGKSIFVHFPGLNMVRSFPHDFMHLLFRNVIPNLIYLWKGKYRRLRDDQGTGNYIISEEDWDAIGEETIDATTTIPSNFVSALPNITTDQHLYTAEMYSFWFLYIGPILLKDRFPDEKYYEHYMDLVKWIKKCMRYVIPRNELPSMQLSIISWVKTYEEYVAGLSLSAQTTLTLFTLGIIISMTSTGCKPAYGLFMLSSMLLMTSARLALYGSLGHLSWNASAMPSNFLSSPGCILGAHLLRGCFALSS